MSYGYSNIEEEEDDVIIIPKYSSLIEIEDYEDENSNDPM
jgi:hypothetical protein